MAKSLTDIIVRQFKASKKRLEMPDSGRGSVPGLYLIVQPSGRKVWAYRYRSPTRVDSKTGYGKHRKLTLGKFGDAPALGVKAARKAAHDAAATIETGADPATEKRTAKSKARDTSDLIKILGPEYIEFRANNPRGGKKQWKARYRQEAERLFKKEVLPKWGDRRIQDITRDDICDLLANIVELQRESGKRGTTANGVYATIISPLFHWAANTRPPKIDASPCPSKEALLNEGLLVEKHERERILEDEEIRWLWRACERECEKEGEEGVFGHFYKLALLTGQRRNEIAGITDRELNLEERTWTIPSERTKNGRPHIVHLSEAVMGIITSLPRVQNDPGYLFCTNGRTHISGYSRAKARIEAAMQKETGGKEIPHWTPHDLRRTVVTRMNEKLRIRPEVVEAAVNHVSGEAKRGVAGVYNRALYLPERQSAFEAWARYVLEVVSDGQPENVVNLHG